MDGTEKKRQFNENTSNKMEKDTLGFKGIRLPCYICHREFDSKSLNRHLRNRHNLKNATFGYLKNQKKIQMGLREEASEENENSENNLKQNLKGSMKNTFKLELPCLYCDKTFTKIKILDIHTQRFHDKLLKKCPHCDKTFMKAKILEIHIQRFHDKIEIKCPYCDTTFIKEQILDIHISKNHDNRSKKICPYCGKPFMKDIILKFHMKREHKEKRKKCPNCEKTFIKEKILEIHILRYHSKIQKSAEPSFIVNSRGYIVHKELKDEYKCANCENTFEKSHELKLHYLKVHLYHYCDICHKSFAYEFLLRKHLQEVHKIVKKSKCKNCGQSFDRSKYLKKHAKFCDFKQNSMKNPLEVVKCPMCDINFSGTKDTLKMHLKFVHKKYEPNLELVEELLPITESEKESITFVSVSEHSDTFSESEIKYINNKE